MPAVTERSPEGEPTEGRAGYAPRVSDGVGGELSNIDRNGARRRGRRTLYAVTTTNKTRPCGGFGWVRAGWLLGRPDCCLPGTAAAAAAAAAQVHTASSGCACQAAA